MSETIDEVRAALQTLVGKTIESVSASDSPDEDDRNFDTIEIVATDGTTVRLETADYEGYSSWLEVAAGWGEGTG